MLYSDEQIKASKLSFKEDFLKGKLKKRDIPNDEPLYHKSIEQEDLEWVLSADPQSKLFKDL
jgi:hypothetical protein